MKQDDEIKFLQRLVAENGLSRRKFLTAAMALGVGAMAPALYSEAARAAPKKGGRLRQGLTGGATSDVLDPGQILDSYMTNVQFGQLRNNLTEVAASGELVGELAESWEANANATQWVFKIRKGVEFHNGKTLDSQDVVDSLNHHIGEKSTSAAAGILTGVDNVKADGANTVVVSLKGGDADFPFILSDYHILVCPSNGDGSIDWQSGIGTGGYSLVDHEAGIRTFTKRNPNYWKEGKAHFDEVESLQLADSSARTTALRTDTVDCIQKVELKTASRLARLPGVKVVATTGNKQITLPMRTDMAPYDNNHVRMALKLIIERKEWLDKIAFGYGEIGNDNPIGPANVYRATTEELPQRGYDPDKAKWHLKQAGMDSLSVEFFAADTGFTGALDAGQLMRESAKPAGINIDVMRQPNDGYWSDVWMKKPWCACYWSGRPTENWMFSQVYAADASWNDTYWKHERFNKLLIQGRAELNTEKRREIYVEMQRIVNAEGGVALPLFLSDVMAINDKLGHPEQLGNNWELDGMKNAERWWFV
ncbi:MAG: ABC transporter substrate-binding protein [Gammaproteobacteria bacterium]|nr:ABC transporter substrate-binding protein [Gammaproteobacteria bacterium]